MGPVEGTESDRQADQFLAALAHATPELIAGIASDQSGDLAAIVAEQRAWGYWNHHVAERADRRAAREQDDRADQAVRLALLDRQPDETARLAPLPEQSAVILSVPRYVILTDLAVFGDEH